ncbi:unnamed protein product [Lampetra fluviatilis]
MSGRAVGRVALLGVASLLSALLLLLQAQCPAWRCSGNGRHGMTVVVVDRESHNHHHQQQQHQLQDNNNHHQQHDDVDEFQYNQQLHPANKMQHQSHHQHHHQEINNKHNNNNNNNARQQPSLTPSPPEPHPPPPPAQPPPPPPSTTTTTTTTTTTWPPSRHRHLRRAFPARLLEPRVRLDLSGHDVVVFLHIQKTGGTTFGRHLVRDARLPVPCRCARAHKRCVCARPSRQPTRAVRGLGQGLGRGLGGGLGYGLGPSAVRERAVKEAAGDGNSGGVGGGGRVDGGGRSRNIPAAAVATVNSAAVAVAAAAALSGDSASTRTGDADEVTTTTTKWRRRKRRRTDNDGGGGGGPPPSPGPAVSGGGRGTSDTWLFSRFSTGWRCGLHADWTELRACVPALFEGAGGPPRNYYYITLLREPTARYLSEWQHVRRGATWRSSPHLCAGRPPARGELPPCYPGADWSGVSLADFLACPHNLAANRQTRMLADLRLVACYNATAVGGADRDRRMLDSAKRNLRAMPFFGLTERQRDSQALFEDAFGMAFGAGFEQLNATRAGGAMATAGGVLDGAARREIARINALDARLYAYALELFEGRVEALAERRRRDGGGGGERWRQEEVVEEVEEEVEEEERVKKAGKARGR